MVLRNLIYFSGLLKQDDVNIPKTEFTAGADGNIQAIINTVFMIIGGLAMIYIVYSGVRLILSQGKPDEVAKARNAIIYGAVGIAVALSAFALVTFVIGKI